MTPLPLRRRTTVAIVCVAGGVAILALWSLLRAPKLTARHVLPEGYHGWVTVDFGVDGTPPLAESDGVVLFSYRGEALQTSSPAPEGTGLPEVYRGDQRLRFGGWSTDWMAASSGDAVAVWGLYDQRSFSTDPQGKQRERRRQGFFVGTREEYEAARSHGLPGAPEAPLPATPAAGS